MDDDLRAGLAALAADAESGASEILPRALELLRTARAQGEEATLETARAIGDAQPSMASCWNAAAAALLDREQPGALERFEQRARRSGHALTRVAAGALLAGDPRPTHFTTFSFSGSVLAALRAVAEVSPIVVACAEGRPRLEGQRMASALAAAGIPVAFHTDAALAVSLPDTDALVVGADAVTPHWFVNKAGTGPLAAAASWMGVPVFVLATREKFLPAALTRLLDFVSHDPTEVWAPAPAGVSISNPYFERVPLDLVTAIVTDAGVLGVDMVEEACRSAGTGITEEIVAELATPTV